MNLRTSANKKTLLFCLLIVLCSPNYLEAIRKSNNWFTDTIGPFIRGKIRRVLDRTRLKVSVKENEVPTEKNSSRVSILATKASYISN